MKDFTRENFPLPFFPALFFFSLFGTFDKNPVVSWECLPFFFITRCPFLSPLGCFTFLSSSIFWRGEGEKGFSFLGCQPVFGFYSSISPLDKSPKKTFKKSFPALLYFCFEFGPPPPFWRNFDGAFPLIVGGQNFFFLLPESGPLFGVFFWFWVRLFSLFTTSTETRKELIPLPVACGI